MARAPDAGQRGRGRHLHVWPRDAPEPIRHRLFRDWLCSHPEDLELYATTKRRLARDTAQQPGDYSLAKNGVIDAIYARIFSSPAGYISWARQPDSHQPGSASWAAISSISFSSPRMGRTMTVKLTSRPSPFQRSMSTPCR